MKLSISNAALSYEILKLFLGKFLGEIARSTILQS